MLIRKLSFTSIVCGLACVAATSCKNSDSSSNPGSDAGPQVYNPPESTALPSKFNVVVSATELHNQPNSKVANKIFPSASVVINEIPPDDPNAPPPPDPIQPGKLPVPGFGCDGQTMQGPPPNAPDVGKVSIVGLTGLGPADKPLNCERQASGPPGAGDAPLAYGCDFPPFPGGDGPPNLALPAPVTRFINKGDKMTVSATGGPDIGAIPAIEVDTAAFTGVTVAQNLWDLKAGMVDGSKDLQIDYACDGGPCDKADNITITMLVTDGEAPPPSDSSLVPYTFPPGGHFAVIFCQDSAPLSPTSYTIKKEIFAKAVTFPWKAIYTEVTPIVARNAATPENQPLILATGYGVFGISRQP